MKLKRHKKLLILFFVMFIFYAIINGSYSIYRERQADHIDLSILDSSVMVTVNFNANGGTMDPSDVSRSVQSGTAVGQLPAVTRSDYIFDGWYTDTTYQVEVTEDTIVTGTTVNYYAHWLKIVCKKASTGTLHSETCDSTGSCASTDGGYSANDTIYYGTIPGVNSPVVGDAYDCDVNDDDIWDPQTERFYFVRSYGTAYPTENSVLVHYTSFDENGQMDSSSSRHSYVYGDASNYLPTSSTWDNPALIEMNGNVTRFITREDLTEACGSVTGGNKFSSCRFYLENSKYQSNSLGKEGIWLLEEGSNHYKIQTDQLTVLTAEVGSENTVRPTIQIPSNRIEGFTENQKYTITLDSQGGTLSEYTFKKHKGETVGTLPVPTKTGYIFDGWYTDNLNFTTEITQNTIVNGTIKGYAKWVSTQEPLEYVFHIPGECSFTSSGITNGVNGDCISTINPTGANIDYTDSSLSIKRYIDTQIGLYDTDNHDKDFEVGFTIENYVPADNIARATIVHSKAEIKDKWPGFTFRRNDNTNNFILQSRNTESTNAQYIANYASIHSVKVYRTNGSIYYSINGGEKTWLNDLDQYNPVFDLTTWFGGAPKDESALVAERFFVGRLSNMYIKLSSEVTVTFDPNYTGASTFEQEVNKSKAIGTLPTESRPGYVLLGWFNDPVDGFKANENTVINDDITLYAHWGEAITITLHPNEGQVVPNTITIAQGSQVGELPIPERTGYTFDGWYQDQYLTVPVTEETVVNQDTDFYAKWIENITVSLNADGGIVIPASKSIVPGTSIGELPTPIKIGHAFLGWYTDNTYQVEVTPSTTFNTTTTIIAKWQEMAAVTINFDADGGDVLPTSKNVAYNGPIGELPTPTKAGNNFVGWYTDNTYQVEVTPSTTFNTTTTIIAKWVDESYVACINTNCYTTLASAVTAVPTTREKTTIKVLQDILVTSYIRISSERNVSLDLQNFTISNSANTIFENVGVLEIKNGTISNTAVEPYYAIVNKAGGVVNITGGTIDSTQTNAISNSGTLNITGGKITCSASFAAINNNTNAILTMSAGEIIGTNVKKGQAIYNNGGTVTISGTAYLKNKSQTASANGRSSLHNYSGTIYILGGTIISENNSAVKNSGTMVIGTDDGTIDNTTPILQGYNYGLEIDNGKTVTIYDGIFKGNSNVNNKAINVESRVNLVNTVIRHTTETIDSIPYDVAYLENN